MSIQCGACNDELCDSLGCSMPGMCGCGCAQPAPGTLGAFLADLFDDRATDEEDTTDASL